VPHRQQLDFAALLPLLERAICGRPRGAEIENSGADVDGKTILITGAGGGIGSALAHRIAAAAPARLVLLDNGEHGLYAIDQAIEQAFPKTQRSAILADIRDGEAMNRCFDQMRPDAIFHAAALKHVPIVEAHPREGILTNILGVRNVLQAASSSGVSGFIQVSTDKAVRPQGVMGATKRVAELLVQAQIGNNPRSAIVRLGNVLGSPGSVVERFLAQIARGAPLTVTDPGVSRYFMTMTEAAGVILHAHRQLGQTTRAKVPVHILDLGQPVKIVNLARAIVDLCATGRSHATQISFTGLRQGEKLLEDLHGAGEQFSHSGTKGVLTAWSAPPPAGLVNQVDEMIGLAHRGDISRALELLWHSVGEPIDRDLDRSPRELSVRA
jgi:FlaA1/EpsC-like NDP-sugar epimerase